MRERILPTDATRALRIARLVALAFIWLLLLAWLIGAVLWVSGVATDPDAILRATFFDQWTAEEIRAAANRLGVSPLAFPLSQLVEETLLVSAFGFLSLLIFFRKPDWFGTYLAVAFMLIGTSAAGALIGRVGTIWPLFNTAYYDVLQTETITLLVLISLPYIFPDGRFVPRWTKWIWVVLTFFLVITPLLPDQPVEVQPETEILGFAIFAVTITSLGLLSQIYRYLRVSGPIEKQQTKGVIIAFALLVALFAVGVGLSPNALTASGPPTPTDLMASVAEGAVALAFVLGFITSVVIALLRYDLWEIDVVVRRTTAYVIVTGMLVLVYFGSVVLLQRLFTILTGQTSTAAIVLSTLLIAALFFPIRRRVQDIIDRRFFRQKYDAEKVLNAFAATVRDETDLDALTAKLVRVIQETMQPEFVSVWLAPEGLTGRDQARSEGESG